MALKTRRANIYHRFPAKVITLSLPPCQLIKVLPSKGIDLGRGGGRIYLWDCERYLFFGCRIDLFVALLFCQQHRHAGLRRWDTCFVYALETNNSHIDWLSSRFCGFIWARWDGSSMMWQWYLDTKPRSTNYLGRVDVRKMVYGIGDNLPDKLTKRLWCEAWTMKSNSTAFFSNTSGDSCELT